jgi:sodium transport system permease protein
MQGGSRGVASLFRISALISLGPSIGIGIGVKGNHMNEGGESRADGEDMGAEVPRRDRPSPRAAVLLLLASALLFLLGGLPLQILLGEGGLLLSQILFLLLPALIFLQAGGFDMKRCLPPRVPRPGEVGFGLLLMTGAVGVAWFLAWAQSWFIPVPVEYLETLERVLRAESVSRFLWLLVLVALVPAVAEEVLFRGAALAGFRSRLPDFWAVIVAGVIFGLFHLSPETAFRFIPTAWLGIVLGWVVVVSGSLPLAMILHLLNNAAILTLTAIPFTREALMMAEQRPPLILLPVALILLTLGARGLRPSQEVVE